MTNRTLLFSVDLVFEIERRGCVLFPGPSIERDATPVRIGSTIQLQLPNGKLIDTRVAGLEMFRRNPPVYTAPLLLPREFSKDQVPPGTQVYLLQSP